MCTFFTLIANAGLLYKKIVLIHIAPTRYDNAYFPIGFYQAFKLLPLHELKKYLGCFNLHAMITAEARRLYTCPSVVCVWSCVICCC